MRQTAVDKFLNLMCRYRVDPEKVSCLEVGGTRDVWLDRSVVPPRSASRQRRNLLARIGRRLFCKRGQTVVTENPLLKKIPGICFLDGGFNAQAIQTEATIDADFLDPEVLKPLQEKFDLVVSFDTLEHVRDPFRFCAHLAKAVRPGGFLFVATVFSWPYHPSPEDYFRFSPAGLRLCLENIGLEIIECEWDMFEVSVYAWGRRNIFPTREDD